MKRRIHKNGIKFLYIRDIGKVDITFVLALYVISTYNEKVITAVRSTKRARKSLEKVPRQVLQAYATWERTVSVIGLAETQKIPGYHDEPLHGKLKGLRSFRLSLGYRGFYRIAKESIEFVLIEEVNKHDYKEIERLFS